MQLRPQPLISEGLESPVGLAMDHARHGLYVADPQALKIYRYIVTATSTGLMVGEAVQAVSNFQARWVAVDSSGNLFFSDEQNNAIYKVLHSRSGFCRLHNGSHYPNICFASQNRARHS